MDINSNKTFFNVVIHHDNIKSFSASLHFLHKIHKEITIEVEASTFTLRGLNDTKSAFVSIEFLEDYFDTFNLATSLKSFSCKLNVKPICIIFRNIKTIKVLKIRGVMIDSEHELVFEILLYNDIIRTYRFRYQDCEVMSAVFYEEQCNYLRAKPKTFLQLLQHIHQSPEIAIETSPNHFIFHSYHNKALQSTLLDTNSTTTMYNKQSKNNTTTTNNNNNSSTQQQQVSRHMSTDLNVDIREFDEFNYQSELPSIELIFCIKELHAFLGYSEVIDATDFTFLFTESGRAIKFGVHQGPYLASLVLATIEAPSQQQAYHLPSISQQMDVEAEAELDIPPITVHSRQQNHPQQQQRQQQQYHSNSRLDYSELTELNRTATTEIVMNEANEDDEDEEEHYINVAPLHTLKKNNHTKSTTTTSAITRHTSAADVQVIVAAASQVVPTQSSDGKAIDIQPIINTNKKIRKRFLDEYSDDDELLR